MIAFIFGTRPEAHKIRPVLSECTTLGIPWQAVCTDQHTTLLEELQDDPIWAGTHHLHLPSDNDPFVYRDRAWVLLEGWLREHQPHAVAVQGDTATAAAGALAGHRLGLPVYHIEAGIRSHDFSQPFPEESFRCLISKLATWHYCASGGNRDNLLREGGSLGHVLVTGNPGMDRLREVLSGRPTPRTVSQRCMVTLHRRESFGRPLLDIVAGLVTACERHPGVEFVWPVHPNPRVAEAVPAPADRPQNLLVLPPLDHRTFARMLATSRAVLTDSGGVQEEAAFLGVPCVVAREKTDRPESVDSGHAVVAGTAVAEPLDQALRYGLTSSPFLGFGDGHAAPRIAAHLQSTL